MSTSSTRLARLAIVTGVICVLTACGGGGDGPAATGTPPPSEVTLEGTAAIGNPIVGGTVTLRCSATVTTTTVTTTASGGWQVDVPANALPCALQVSGGTVGSTANTISLHSLAQAAGVTNITQLTDLMLAIGTASNPTAWFAGAGTSSLASAASAMSAAQTQVINALTAAGYTVPSGLNPLSTAFTATSGNAYDDLLEALMAGLQGANQTYATLLAAATQAGATPLALPAPSTGNPPVTPPPGVLPTLTPLNFTTSSTNAEVFAAIVGSHQVNVYKGPHPGAATLTITYDGTRLVKTLHSNASNTLIFSVDVAADMTPEMGGGRELRWVDPTSQYPFAPAGGFDINIWHYYNTGTAGATALRTAYLPDGRIRGAVGDYLFRNDVIAGAAIPAVFAKLAETPWVGRTRLCHDDAAPLRVTATAEGSITINALGGPIAGFSGWSCNALEVVNTWDGDDDFIEHNGEGWMIHLDSSRGHGSQPGGGIRLLLDSLDDPTQIISIYSGFFGAHTNIDNDAQPPMVRQVP